MSRHETVSCGKGLCLYCQVELQDESLYIACQISRGQILKDTFFQRPTSPKLYKIRSSHVYDAMAGDIKIPQFNFGGMSLTNELQRPKFDRNHAAMLEVQEIYECSIVPDEIVSCLDVSDSDRSHLRLEKKAEL